MSDPTPEEVEGFFDDPEFIRLPPGCGEPHPVLPNIFCGKDEGCVDYHLARIPQADLSTKAESWPNEKKTPKPEKQSNQAKARGIAERTGSVTATAGAPSEALRKESGMAAAMTLTPEDFKSAFYEAVHRLALVRESFTSDDVWTSLDAAGIDTENRAGVGPLMAACAAKGWTEKSGEHAVSSRPGSKARDGLTVWRSLIYQPVPTTSSVLQDFG